LTIYARIRLIISAMAFAIIPALPAMAQTPVVSLTATPMHALAPAGSSTAFALVMEHEHGWHTYPNKPVAPEGFAGFNAIPTEVESVTLASGDPLPPWLTVDIADARWPKPHLIETGALGDRPVKLLSYEGTVVILLPVHITPDAPAGTLTLNVTIGYQACDDTVCLMPDAASTTVSLAIAPAGTPAQPGASSHFTGYDPAASIAQESQPPAPVVEHASSRDLPFEVLGLSFTIDTAGWLGRILLVLVALVGGLILNLTPCVLPVIPIKMISLTQSAGNPARSMMMGIAMSIGVIAFWLAIGGVISASTSFKAASQLIGIWWFGLGVGVFIFVMAMGLFGAFTVQLPEWVHMINPKHDTLKGSFVFGILTAVLSTPCVAPFMGTAVAWAAFQPMGMTLLTFGSVGVGMAVPYMLLSANPNWISRVPRTGPAGELVKQVMGMLTIAVSIFFIGTGLLGLIAEQPWLGGVLHWWFIAAVGVMTGAWLMLRTFQITPSPIRRAIFSLVALFVAIPPIGWAHFQTNVAFQNYTPPGAGSQAHGVWHLYDEAKVLEAEQEGKVVVLEFTAEWCLNCKTLEAAVLNRSEVQDALKAEGVYPVKVDLTSRSAPGWKRLRDMGEAGIPLLAIKGPGSTGWVKSNAYSTTWVLDQIAAARGQALGRTEGAE